MIPSWARKGVRVVCVNHAPEAGKRFYNPLPPLGETLVVSGTWVRDDGVLCLRIEGFPNWSRFQQHFDRGWVVHRFRPVLDLKDDAEVEMALYYKKGLHQSVSRKKSVDA